MFRVECMCGAELEVSEASSSSAMRVNPHECKGWQGFVDKFDENVRAREATEQSPASVPKDNA